MAILALRCQLALNHHLCGNSGVVGARLPEGIAALHTTETNKRIHDRVIKPMTHV